MAVFGWRRPRKLLEMFLAFTKIRPARMSASKKPSTREIERKFLLKRFPPGLKECPHDTIVQGYLAVGRGGLQVRLRKKGSVRSLTFKQGTKGEREERETYIVIVEGRGDCCPRQDLQAISFKDLEITGVAQQAEGAQHLERSEKP